MSINLSSAKRGPKTYIPPRFQCPTANCTSIFSRKYDLLKHLKKCNATLIDSPDVKNLKDSVRQHCKNCDKVIKGGHLAKHKAICEEPLSQYLDKIKITNNARQNEKEVVIEHDKESNKVTNRDHPDKDKINCKEHHNKKITRTKKSNNARQNEEELVIEQCKTSDKVTKIDLLADHESKYKKIREHSNEQIEIDIAARQNESNNVSNTPSIISDDGPNPIDLQINQYINRCYNTPKRAAILNASCKKITDAIIKDKLNYLDDPGGESSDYNWNTVIHSSENRSNNMVVDLENMTNGKNSIKQTLTDHNEDEHFNKEFRKDLRHIATEETSSEEDRGIDNVNPGPSKYHLRVKSTKNDYNDTIEKWEKETLSSTALDDLSQSIQSWRVSMHDESTDNSIIARSDITNTVFPNDSKKSKSNNKGKCIIGRKNIPKKCTKKQDVEKVTNIGSFDPNLIPEFLSFPNINVSPLYKDKKFEKWNTAYKNWFIDKNRVASKTPNTNTIQQYLSELCRYGEYVHESMKKKNVNWSLNDLLRLNKSKGSTFNSENGIIFFEDPTQYILDDDMPLPRRLKLLMALVHATELLASTLISGHNDCTLSITECVSRKSALVTFKERLLKQYSCIFGSNFCHRQKDRLLLHKHKGSEIPVDLLKQILNI